MFRRLARVAPAVLAVAAAVVPSLLGGQRPAAAAITWPRLVVRRVVGGLTQPTLIADPGDGSGRLFVAERAGVVRIMRDGALAPTPFLDIRDRVASGFAEQGLGGLAFPPGFPGKGYVYVDYTRSDWAVVVSRFHLAGPDQADPGSEEVLLVIPKPFPNHNGQQLAFGPRDGYLYVAVGDGGEGGTGPDPDNAAQTVIDAEGRTMLRGKILRLDVESGATPYAIPPSNPVLAGRRSEIWAMGLRNPWRFSFDRETGDLYIADVGKSLREEIDVQPAASTGGENYGWHYREGTLCVVPTLCDLPGLVPPVIDYTHDWGNCAVIGGYVYRGDQYPRMRGIYFYGDYCTGRIWGLARDAGGPWQSAELAGPAFSISSFGQDGDGTLYVADYSGGAVDELSDPDVVAPTPTPTPDCAPLGGATVPTTVGHRTYLPRAAAGCPA